MKKYLLLLITTFSLLGLYAQTNDTIIGKSGYLKYQYNNNYINSNFIRQGGNSFGGAMTIGTNDNNHLFFRTNNVNGVGLTGAILYNAASINNAQLNLGAGGARISRNISDASSALNINQANSSSTGNIVEFQKGSATVSQINTDGSMTFGNGASANGIALYNTSDQVTNYERVRAYWNSNVFDIRFDKGGTGVERQIRIANNAGVLLSTGNVQLGAGYGINGGTGIIANSSPVGSSGNTLVFGVYPTVNQTSTANFIAQRISPYFQSKSSGTNLLFDVGYNTAANNGGTHTSVYSVSDTGEIVGAVLPEYADNTAAKAALGNRNGVYYRTGDVIKQTHP